MSYICLAHNSYGSMYEASCATYKFGPYDDFPEANAAAKAFESAANDEWWVTVIRMPAEHMPVELAIAAVKERLFDE